MKTKEELKSEISDIKRQIDLKVKYATRALNNDELEKAEKLEQEITDLRSQIQEKQEELDKLKEKDGTSENNPQSVEVNEARTYRNQANINDLGISIQNTKVTSQEVRDFTEYLETRNDIQGGSLKTDSGFVVIPEEIVTDILKLKEVEFNLDKYVTVKRVTNGSGKYPVVRQSEVAALEKVEELEENPELAVKPFFQLAYDINTHRGYFRISREAIEDAAINLNVKPNYEHNVAIVSQTMFAKLDKMKDKLGNYLIQPDVKEKKQQRLLGAKIEILPDEVLGQKGNNTLIIGNLKDAIVLFDRSQYQASWTDYMHFGECLMIAVRQDCRILDYKSAIVIEYDDSERGEGDLDLEA